MLAHLALRDGQTVTIDGHDYVMDSDGLPRQHGDTYIAERNTGPKLLTVKDFTVYFGYGANNPRTPKWRDLDGPPSWINPVERAYPYDFYECVKVRRVTNPTQDHSAGR